MYGRGTRVGRDVMCTGETLVYVEMLCVGKDNRIGRDVMSTGETIV